MCATVRLQVHTHSQAPGQSGGVVLFDEGLQLGPDGQVRAHPVHVTPVAEEGKRNERQRSHL